MEAQVAIDNLKSELNSANQKLNEKSSKYLSLTFFYYSKLSWVSGKIDSLDLVHIYKLDILYFKAKFVFSTPFASVRFSLVDLEQ